MAGPLPPFEPFRTTLLRTALIAAVGGLVLARWPGSRVGWPLATLLCLWVSFGGHWVELWYLNWLRPRISSARHVQIVARVATWFVGGTGLAYAMALTAQSFTGFQPARWPAWWVGGCAFIGVELVAHLALQLRGRASFYNGQS